MTFFGLVYDLGLHLYACASLPKMLKHYQKYKGTFLKRLGAGFPHLDKQGRQLIWIHAVSLGETKAVIPLIKRLKGLPVPPLILLSTTTQTGHAEGLKYAPADHHVYLPFDFSYVIRPIMRRISPDLVVLTETDFWYHFQQAAKENGARIVLINGKISERSFERLSRLPFVSKHLFGPIDHFFLQGELYQQRFTQLNIPASKLTITGNLKLDSESETCDAAALKKQLGLTSELVLTLGSTHDPEERLFIAAYKQLMQQFPTLKMLVVPRHPERFEAVAHLLQAENLSFSRWSQDRTLQDKRILLVDAMGVLKRCYQISDIAFVGGSFTEKVGGHNILEPAFYGKPVIFGPYMHSQPDFLDLVRTYYSGLQVDAEILLPTLVQLLSDPALCHTLGQNGQKLITASRGALDKTFTSLLSLLKKNGL
jgi:3-deoxy-D-manno-octulosonic-acid transferase